MTDLLFPQKPCPGDAIALLSPSSPLAEEKPVEAIADALEAAGYRVWVGESTRGAEAEGYAAPVEARVRDIRGAFCDPDIKAIWCTRGGETAWRLLNRLDWKCIAAHPKPFIGFSDVTTLHAAIHQRCGMVTFHGPMASALLGYAGSFTWRSLRAAVEMGDRLAVENPPGEPVVCLRPGKAQGVLAGGNLSLIAAGVGTPWQLDTRGRILFLEDVGEEVYALERMLVQLKWAGLFQRAAGVVLGPFTDWVNKRNPGWGPEELLREFFRDYPKPVLANVRSGHCEPMVTLPLGTMCCIDAGAGTIVCRRRMGR